MKSHFRRSPKFLLIGVHLVKDLWTKAMIDGVLLDTWLEFPEFWLAEIFVKRNYTYVIEQVHRFALDTMKAGISMISILQEMNLPNAEYWTKYALCESFISIDSYLLSDFKKKSKYACFISEILKYCANNYVVQIKWCKL